MDRLIEIRSVPIEIEMKISPARLEYTRGTADLEISRDEGMLSIKSKPIKVNIDSYDARSSVIPSLADSLRQYAQYGRQAAYEASATYATHGQLLLKARIGEDMIAQFAREVTDKHMETNVCIKFIPQEPVKLDWDPAELNIRFEMDKLNLDWKMNKAQFEFIPGNIEISITQMPDVIIEYVGGPVIFPSPAANDSEVIDVIATTGGF